MLTQSLPRGFVLRRPTLDDLSSVLALTHACEVERDGVPETTLDDIRTWWQVPDFNLAEDSWIVLTPENQLVAFASVEQQQHARIYVGGDVHPAYRGRGIGTHLLHLNEARAKEHLAQAAPGVRVSMLSWVSYKATAAQRLLEKHDFQQIRSSWRMGIEVKEAPPAPEWAEGVSLHTLAEHMDLFRAVYEADDEAFRDHWGYMPITFEEWEHWTRKREHFDPSLWFLAMDGDSIAAIALCQDEKAQGGWVHSLAVRRPWRRKGVGLALLRHAFGEFYKRGISNVYLGVDAQNLTGATRLYERVGMHVVRQTYIYEKELRAGRELSTQSVDI